MVVSTAEVQCSSDLVQKLAQNVAGVLLYDFLFHLVTSLSPVHSLYHRSVAV